jgi:hypothetical protein
MEERQIIHNLKALQEIKPDSAWKQATKARILDDLYNTNPGKTFSWGFLPSWTPKLKLAPAVISGTLAILIGLGVFALFDFYAPFQDSQEPELGIAEISEQGPLAEIRNSLAEIGKTLANDQELKNPETTGKIVRTVNEIKGKLQKLETTINTADTTDITDTTDTTDTTNTAGIADITYTAETEIEAKDLEEVRAAIIATEEQIDQALRNNIQFTSAELAKSLIQMTKTRSLTEEQEGLLKEAEALYNEGEYQQALEKIDFIFSY